MTSPSLHTLSSPGGPRLTGDHSGTTGVAKQSPEDFVVEEIPLYAPTGEGEHLWIVIRKRDMTTAYLARRLSREFGISTRDIGYAGRKDRQAVTTQAMTLRGADPERAGKISIDGLEILEVTRHQRRIRRGHLKCNRFRLRVRQVDPALAAHARHSATILTERGLPNYFGPQRFGRSGTNATIGAHLLLNHAESAAELLLSGSASTRSVRRMRHCLDRGDSFEKAVSLLSRDEKRLYLESLQSALFNRCLAQRLPTFDQVEKGDLAWIHQKGAVFLVENPLAESPRAQRFEISPSGPIFGSKMTPSQESAGELEANVLRATLGPEVTTATWRSTRLRGARRPYRVPIQDLEIQYEEPTGILQTAFSLPPGSYATGVLRELLGNDEFLPTP